MGAPPLIAALERFPDLYQPSVIRRFLWRLGVVSKGADEDKRLVEAAERSMVRDQIPIDAFFHGYRGGRTDAFETQGADQAAFEEILRHYSAVNASDDYWVNNPTCSMLIDEVEAIWAAIAQADDWQPLYQKLWQIQALGQALKQNG